MKLLNWNIRGISKNWAELLVLSENYDIIALSETKLTVNRTDINIKGFNHIRVDRSDGSNWGGLVVYIRNNMQYMTFRIDNLHEGIEYIACKIYKENRHLNLVSVYIAPHLKISRMDFDTLFYANSHINNLLITGDFNGHNELWSLKSPDNRGNLIYESLSNFDLNVLNNRDKFTRTYKDGSEIRFSSPDISLASSDLFLELEWDTLDFRGSDHKPININFKNSNLKFDRLVRKVGLKNVIWEKFTEINVNNFDYGREINSGNFEDEYADFIDCIYRSLEESGGKLPKDITQGNENKARSDKEPPGALWWTAKCQETVIKRREALNTFTNEASVENFDKYVNIVKETREILKKEKEAGFKNFCNSLNFKTPYDIICKGVKNLKKRFLDSKEFSIPKVEIMNNEEVWKCFNKISKNYVYNDIEGKIGEHHSYERDSVLSQEISDVEVGVAISNSKNRSAPGRDMISYSILKYLPIDSYKWLAKLFNFVLFSGKFIKDWRKYNVCFISKGANKGYRPIALSNTILKILERILNDRLQWFCETKGLIPKSFFGFRRGRSCYDCLSILRTDIAIAKLKKKYLGLLSLDLQSAYDGVCLEKLIEVLKFKGIPPSFLKFIYNLINDRELFGQFGGIEIGSKITNKGLPKGSILSPILFNLYISDIIFQLHHNCKFLSFADDILIYSSNTEVEMIIRELSDSAQDINDWLKSLKLSISFEKSRLMFFSKDGREFRENSCYIQFDNCILNNCNFIKYLGVYIDSNLNFDIHVKYVTEKVNKLLNMFRCLCRFSYGSHPSMAIKIYKQFLRPALDWGGFLISECNSKIKKKLDVVQNSALGSSLGCIRTTPINVLLHLAGIETLQFKRDYLTKRFLSRQTLTTDSMLIPKLKLLKEYIDKKKDCPNYIKFFFV